MANIIKSHNQKILNENNGVSSERKCNCRNKDLCPLNGACFTSNVIYEATVTTTTRDTKTHIGMTEHGYKQDTTTTNSLSETESIRTAQYFRTHLGLERQQHRLSNQLAHQQAGKCVQRQPFPLKPVSV